MDLGESFPSRVWLKNRLRYYRGGALGSLPALTQFTDHSPVPPQNENEVPFARRNPLRQVQSAASAQCADARVWISDRFADIPPLDPLSRLHLLFGTNPKEQHGDSLQDRHYKTLGMWSYLLTM